MSHTVTPQTALQLKAAGFPQPSPDTRQVWYNDAGTPYYVTAANGWRCDYVAGETLFIDRYLNGDEVFAPTAEDILRELGTGWCAIRSEVPNADLWRCAHLLYGEFSGRCWGQNLAETCAAAYLEQQPQK